MVGVIDLFEVLISPAHPLAHTVEQVFAVYAEHGFVDVKRG